MSTTPTPEGLIQAAKYVAFSNGFDAGFPQKMEALRTILRDIPHAQKVTTNDQMRDALQRLVDLRGHGSWGGEWVEAWDKAYAALSSQPPSAQEASDLISSYTNALVAWRCDGGPFGEVEAAEKELRAALAGQAKSAAPVEPAPFDQLPIAEQAAKLIEELDTRADQITRYSNSPDDGLMAAAARMIERLTTPPAAIPEAPAQTEAKGTFACPVCGKDMPHHHPEGADFDEFKRVMALPEAEVDAELRGRGIDPETAAQRVARAIDDAALDAARADVGTGIHRDLYNRIVRHALKRFAREDDAARLPGDDDTKESDRG